MNDQQKLDRADKARRLLESETFKLAWDALKVTLHGVMESGTDEQAMEARRQLQVMNRVYQNLQTFLQDEALIKAHEASRKSHLRL